jgi:hypothetical protein
LEQLRRVMDTTPGSPDAKPSKPGNELAVPAEKQYVAAPPEDDFELEEDLEFAAELEVGLTDEQLLGAPDPLASETGEVQGAVQNGHNGNGNGNGGQGEQHARAGKGGTGRDAA